MFISDKIVFLELQKTGCSHIRRTLVSIINGQIEGKHNQVRSDLFNGKRAFVGSIRDPWEWYLSLWSYGCGHKGTLFQRLTRPLKLQLREAKLGQLPSATMGAIASIASRNFKDWERVYQNVEDVGAFREWLHMMYDSQYRYDLGEGWGISSIHSFAGLLTHRYIKLFCLKAEDTNFHISIQSVEQLKKYDETHCFVNHFIRNENLVSDLFGVLDAVNISIPAQKKEEILKLPKTNTSSRSKGPSDYYDSSALNLVSRHESLIINKFGYCPPAV